MVNKMSFKSWTVVNVLELKRRNSWLVLAVVILAIWNCILSWQIANIPEPKVEVIKEEIIPMVNSQALKTNEKLYSFTLVDVPNLKG